MTTEKSIEHKKDIWLSSYARFILLGEIVWFNAYQLFNETYIQSVAERKVCSNLNLWMNELILIGNNGLVTKHASIVLITFSFVRTYIYVIPFIIPVSRQQTVTKRKWIYSKRFLKQLKKIGSLWKFKYEVLNCNFQYPERNAGFSLKLWTISIYMFSIYSCMTITAFNGSTIVNTPRFTK